MLIMQKKILLIDDEESVVKSIKRLFHAEKDITVDAILNASELDGALQRVSYDLVLVDVMMPGVDGIEVVRRIQKYHGDKALTIITLSGNYPDDCKLLLESMGVYRCEDKPFDPEHFKAMIKDVLSGYLNEG
jgi:DNA-binding response OmpR family regulator